MNDDRNHSSLLVPPSTQDHIQGVLSAKVVLVMYGDYQCSRSANVYKMIKVIDRELSASLGEDYLCFIFRHFPQAQIHPHAQRAAQAAEAAAAQGQFWLMNDTLFTHQQKLENGYLVEYANDLGLDIPQFLKDLSKQVHIDRINEDHRRRNTEWSNDYSSPVYQWNSVYRTLEHDGVNGNHYCCK